MIPQVEESEKTSDLNKDNENQKKHLDQKTKINKPEKPLYNIDGENEKHKETGRLVDTIA